MENHEEEIPRLPDNIKKMNGATTRYLDKCLDILDYALGRNTTGTPGLHDKLDQLDNALTTNIAKRLDKQKKKLDET